LGKTAVIAGLFDKLEIWNEEEWERYKAGAEKNSPNIAEHLGI
jgi:MraZ protein